MTGTIIGSEWVFRSSFGRRITCSSGEVHRMQPGPVDSPHRQFAHLLVTRAVETEAMHQVVVDAERQKRARRRQSILVAHPTAGVAGVRCGKVDGRIPANTQKCADSAPHQTPEQPCHPAERLYFRLVAVRPDTANRQQVLPPEIARIGRPRPPRLSDSEPVAKGTSTTFG